jgi:ElaB/YqjD/DUF883 family membrane-anchored ribosome-binding protein
MKRNRSINFDYILRVLGKCFALLVVGVMWITGSPFVNNNAYAENTGLGLKGSNPERGFYESKVLDKPAQNDRGGFYRGSQKEDTLSGPGKMYPYSDVDPRQDTTRAQAKANNLVRNAKENVVDRAQDSKTVAREVRQKREAEAKQIKGKLEDTPNKLGDQAKSNVRQLKDELDQDSKNLKNNTEDFAESLPRVAKQGAQNLKGKVKETADDLSGLGESSKRIAERAKDASKEAASNAKDKLSLAL